MRTQLDKLLKKMNQVPGIVRNPAYVAEVELDEDGVDPADLAPLVSGNAPIVTAPASEDGDVAEDVEEDKDKDEDTDVLVQTMHEVMDRLSELNKELENMVSYALEDTGTQEPLVDPNVNVWDARKAWEQEFSLYPVASREEVYSRIYIQVGKLLHHMQEPVDQQTWNRDDKYMTDGLTNIIVKHFRLCRLTERALRDQANEPNM